MDEQWVRLATFNSESEALVVQSFLRANGLEVQLLDTYINSYLPSLSLAGSGMRLMVRAEQVERATQLLQERERSNHLSVVDEERPPHRHRTSRLIGALLILAVIAFYWISRLR